jgi:hypothetical protein
MHKGHSPRGKAMQSLSSVMRESGREMREIEREAESTGREVKESGRSLQTSSRAGLPSTGHLASNVRLINNAKVVDFEGGDFY